jgi:lysophospholipase L1-like esterase
VIVVISVTKVQKKSDICDKYHNFACKKMKKTLFTIICMCSCVFVSGQVLSVIGDSYVANHRAPQSESWHAKWAEQNGYEYQNVGRNGGCVAFDRTRDGFGPSMMVRYRQLSPEAAIVLIIAGHNDADKCGDNRDSVAMFGDSLTVLIDLIRQQCPKAKVGYVTPWAVDRPGFKEIHAAILRVCKKKKVPVLDNFKKSCPIRVLDDEFRRKYFQAPNDKAHLNAAGHDLYLPYASEWMKQF